MFNNGGTALFLCGSRVTITPSDELMPAEPATTTGVLIGYARVSTSGQLLDRQITALKAAGRGRIYSDKNVFPQPQARDLHACSGDRRTSSR